MAKQCVCGHTSNDEKNCDGTHKRVVTVYTNPNCTQCEQTKKFLDKENIPYNVVSFTEDQESLKKFIDMGFKSAPIVVTKTDTWSGFRIDKLKGLIEEKK